MADFYAAGQGVTKDISGKDVDFNALKGKVVLVVNVASQCGFTAQYKGLQELHDKYHSKGLEILAFPCNQFGGQEPGGPEQIVDFCTKNFGVTFPVMQKVDVNGKDTHPVFGLLKKERTSLMMEMVKWNFEKWLVARDGKVVARYLSSTTPQGMASDIEKQLSA
ncbi:MAG: hypothetical protein WDW36_009795 [Sanguina aurantia]